jgi:hypothetical protein
MASALAPLTVSDTVVPPGMTLSCRSRTQKEIPTAELCPPTGTVAGTGERGPNFSLALEEGAEVSVDVAVVVPGTKRPDGSFLPRIVWEQSSSHAQVEAPTAAQFTVDGFLLELRKLQDKKK